MTVGRLDAEMTAAEFLRWQALEQVEPFGQVRDDLRAALVGHALASLLWSAWFKGAPKFKPADFIIGDTGRPRRQSADEIRARLMAFASAHNARLAKGK